MFADYANDRQISWPVFMIKLIFLFVNKMVHLMLNRYRRIWMQRCWVKILPVWTIPTYLPTLVQKFTWERERERERDERKKRWRKESVCMCLNGCVCDISERLVCVFNFQYLFVREKMWDFVQSQCWLTSCKGSLEYGWNPVQTGLDLSYQEISVLY